MVKVVRPLNAKERRVLERGVVREKKLRQAIKRRSWTVPLAMFGTLWALTVWAEPSRWQIASVVWLVIGVGMSFWVFPSLKKEADTRVDRYESALGRNEAFVCKITTGEMVQFEEIDDEGACYAFQLEGEGIVFLNSQELYPSARFPNDDFEIVQIFDEKGTVVEEVVEKFGTKLKPARMISAAVKKSLRIPGHLEVINGRLDNLEELLNREGS